LGKGKPKEKELFERRLRSDEYAGRIIKWTSIFEAKLDFLLAAYFVNPVISDSRDACSIFMDQVLSRMSFAAKIDLLRNVRFSKPLRSQKGVVEELDKLRKLRNVLAHNHHLSDRDIYRLRSDKWIFEFVLNHPQSTGRVKNAMENRFSHLWNSCLKSHTENMEAHAIFKKRLV
jgi:hypothetical protein